MLASFTMPKDPPSSTTRYYYLYSFIKSFSKVIVYKYSTYVIYKYIYKVYIYLGKYSKYLYYSQYYNIRVTELEFKYLLFKKDKLYNQIYKAYSAQDIAIKVYKKALEELYITYT